MTTIIPAQQLDARGLRCPLPILRAKRAMRDLEIGEILYVIATDAGSTQDFEAFARQTGNTLVKHFERQGEYHFYLQKNN